MLKKYNFGCGRKSTSGYVNVDALDLSGNVEIVHDLTETPYPFAKGNEADEIMAIEFLEHISFRDTQRVLTEWHRILNFGGKLIIQVPDCGKAMEYFVRGEICDCVPHKAEGWNNFVANANCPKCKGKAKINPIRWQFSFTGAQKTEFDVHRNIFTKETMKLELESAGFKNIQFIENPYKIIVSCQK